MIWLRNVLSTSLSICPISCDTLRPNCFICCQGWIDRQDTYLSTTTYMPLTHLPHSHQFSIPASHSHPPNSHRHPSSFTLPPSFLLLPTLTLLSSYLHPPTLTLILPSLCIPSPSHPHPHPTTLTHLIQILLFDALNVEDMFPHLTPHRVRYPLVDTSVQLVWPSVLVPLRDHLTPLDWTLPLNLLHLEEEKEEEEEEDERR